MLGSDFRQAFHCKWSSSVLPVGKAFLAGLYAGPALRALLGFAVSLRRRLLVLQVPLTRDIRKDLRSRGRGDQAEERTSDTTTSSTEERSKWEATERLESRRRMQCLMYQRKKFRRIFKRVHLQTQTSQSRRTSNQAVEASLDTIACQVQFSQLRQTRKEFKAVQKVAPQIQLLKAQGTHTSLARLCFLPSLKGHDGRFAWREFGSLASLPRERACAKVL